MKWQRSGAHAKLLTLRNTPLWCSSRACRGGDAYTQLPASVLLSLHLGETKRSGNSVDGVSPPLHQLVCVCAVSRWHAGALAASLLKLMNRRTADQ